MGSYQVTQEVKDQVLARIKNDGITAAQAARDHGISVKSIYRWLKQQADGTGNTVLELARVKRENRDLLTLVGKLTMYLETEKKKRGG